MKTLIRKLLPGVLATLATACFAMFCVLRAQSPKPVSPGDGAVAAPVYAQAPAYAQASSPAQVLICGVCGAQLQQPQTVMVAPGMGQPADYGRSYPAPRQAYAVDAYYPQAPAPCAEPVIYAPAYYSRPVSVDPFQEVRVNPIPFPGQVRAYYPNPAPHYGHGRN